MMPTPEKQRSAAHFSPALDADRPVVKLTRENVLSIAHLARLEIAPGELDGVVAKLERIVGFVDQLKAADTAGLEPMAHPMDMSQRLRPDAVTETDQRDRIQQNATGVTDGLYTVPRVIE
jgi:aspartyl-tRNA(Asn)/glutamyl-tRNA(Gln) amidotransferase subunit C